MRLYKSELYKLCSRKRFLFGTVGVLTLFLIYFWVQLTSISSMVDGVQAWGYQAVQMDRAITKDWKGTLTDDKVAQIADLYGFPHIIKENYNNFVDFNFLNTLIHKRLSDGYINTWRDYKIATHIIPIADSILGEFAQESGMPVILEYYYGWYVFLEVLTFSILAASIFIIFIVSPIFSEEIHIGTIQLLFTTKEGKGMDIAAKIAAALTVSIGIFAIIVLLDFLLCGVVFGLDGLDCFTGLVLEDWGYGPLASMPIRTYIPIVLISDFIGILLLCAISLFLSAFFSSPYPTVVVNTLCWSAPFILRIFFHKLYLFQYMSPVYMVLHYVHLETDWMGIRQKILIFAFVTTIVLIIASVRRYRIR